MSIQHAVHWTIAGAALCGVVLLAGCEDAPSNEGVDNFFNNNPFPSSSTPSEQAASLSISPLSSSARTGQQINFTATGGTTPMTWAVATPANGSVAAQGNTRNAIYTHTGPSNTANNVVVRDAAGSSAVADINL